MWLPALADALTSGRVDVVITCGLIPAPDGIGNELFCAEPLLVGLRPEHRLTGHADIERFRGNVRSAECQTLSIKSNT